MAASQLSRSDHLPIRRTDVTPVYLIAIYLNGRHLPAIVSGIPSVNAGSLLIIFQQSSFPAVKLRLYKVIGLRRSQWRRTKNEIQDTVAVPSCHGRRS